MMIGGGWVRRSMSFKSPKLLLLETCTNLSQLKPIHGHMIRTLLIDDVFAASRLIAFCTEQLAVHNRESRGISSSSLLDYSNKIFSQIPNPNLFIYNAMIRACSASQNPQGSFDFFRQMLQLGGIPPDNLTFPFLLKSCARFESFELGKQVHCQVIQYGFEFDPYVQSSLVNLYSSRRDLDGAGRIFSGIAQLDIVSWTSMITAYNKCGHVQLARRMFDEMPERKNLVTWSSMIGGYAQNGYFHEAIELFEIMQLEKVKANETIMVSVISSCADLGALEQGERAHEYVIKNNLTINLILGTALVDMYAKCGDVYKATRIFEQLPERDVLCWTTIISGFAMNGYAKSSLEYFHEMVNSGVAPRDITFTALLSACSHGGLVRRGFELFDRMKIVYGIEARLEHYGCMVDLLGRAGRLKEAEKFVLDMPIIPNAPIWGALLGACRIHKNVEIGERAGKILTQLQPEHSGYYVLLSNIYARDNRWEDVRGVRQLMKGRRVKKSPGHSLIEMEGKVYKFVTGDKSHPEIDRIEATWEEILRRIRVFGYAGNTGGVFFDIDEEEKETSLARHSEKLAIAFGIMKTGAGTTIRIVKNLRVCEDCHTATKLVSEVFDRRIIMRDRYRFHHVMKGECSCKDYW